MKRLVATNVVAKAPHPNAVTLRALEKAIKLRCPEAGLLHHSDQGGPYTCEDYRAVLEARGVKVSMSRKGNCIDNAAMKSWFSTLKSATFSPVCSVAAPPLFLNQTNPVSAKGDTLEPETGAGQAKLLAVRRTPIVLFWLDPALNSSTP